MPVLSSDYPLSQWGGGSKIMSLWGADLMSLDSLLRQGRLCNLPVERLEKPFWVCACCLAGVASPASFHLALTCPAVKQEQAQKPGSRRRTWPRAPAQGTRHPEARHAHQATRTWPRASGFVIYVRRPARCRACALLPAKDPHRRRSSLHALARSAVLASQELHSSATQIGGPVQQGGEKSVRESADGDLACGSCAGPACPPWQST